MNRFFCGLRLGLCGLLAALVYVCVHEGGHILAAMATGRSVVDVTIVSLKPQVLLHGSATAGENAFAAVAGSALVVVVWAVLSLCSRRETFALQSAGFFAGIEMLAWFVSAAVDSWSPQGNDASQFLAYSGVSPSAVMLLIGALASLWLACTLRTPASGQKVEGQPVPTTLA